jgi:hypothetical protein
VVWFGEGLEEEVLGRWILLTMGFDFPEWKNITYLSEPNEEGTCPSGGGLLLYNTVYRI